MYQVVGYQSRSHSDLQCLFQYHLHQQQTVRKRDQAGIRETSYLYITHYKYAPELAVSMISATVVEGLLPLPHSSILPYSSVQESNSNSLTCGSKENVSRCGMPIKIPLRSTMPVLISPALTTVKKNSLQFSVQLFSACTSVQP